MISVYLLLDLRRFKSTLSFLHRYKYTKNHARAFHLTPGVVLVFLEFLTNDDLVGLTAL